MGWNPFGSAPSGIRSRGPWVSRTCFAIALRSASRTASCSAFFARGGSGTHLVDGGIDRDDDLRAHLVDAFAQQFRRDGYLGELAGGRHDRMHETVGRLSGDGFARGVALAAGLPNLLYCLPGLREKLIEFIGP